MTATQDRDRIDDIIDEAADMDRGGRETAEFIRDRIRKMDEPEPWDGKLEPVRLDGQFKLLSTRLVTESWRIVAEFPNTREAHHITPDEARAYARLFVNALPMREELESIERELSDWITRMLLRPDEEIRAEVICESVRAVLKELER